MTKLVVAAAVLLSAPPALAKQVGGVEFPDAISVGGQQLELNGAGVRKKFVFEVYAGGLYLAEPSGDPDAIVRADAPKRVRMVFLRDVTRDQILDTYREGFRNNGAPPEAAAKLDQLAPALVNMKRGGEMFVTYVPGQGTTVSAVGGKAVTVEGKDFADAMFRNWLGPKPADNDLKKAFLGRK